MAAREARARGEGAGIFLGTAHPCGKQWFGTFSNTVEIFSFLKGSVFTLTLSYVHLQ